MQDARETAGTAGEMKYRRSDYEKTNEKTKE